jgi:two-component sensor histidine kinase
LPAGFSLEVSKGLGLSIVQALVTGELGGSIELDGGTDASYSGTRIHIRVPLAPTSPVEL